MIFVLDDKWSDMLDFIYDSLETVKKLKFPSWKQIGQLTIGIFVLVIISGLYFVFVDTLFSDGYRAFYSLITNQEISATTGVNLAEDTDQAVSLSGVEALLSWATVQVADESASTPTEILEIGANQ